LILLRLSILRLSDKETSAISLSPNGIIIGIGKGIGMAKTIWLHFLVKILRKALQHIKLGGYLTFS